jgi:hypothetical protein
MALIRMEKKMTEENTTPEVEVSETASELSTEVTEVSEIDWKKEARKWESRAKAAQSDQEAAKKWREYEEALKPVQERQAQELEELKSEAKSAKVNLLRYEVAAENGIPPLAVKLLNGDNKEELEESAQTLLNLLNTEGKQKTLKPDTNQGKPSVGGSSTADQFASALSDLL